MALERITDLIAASTLAGDELVEISQRSQTVTITATTISALASDNSYNDSGSGFLAAGFQVNDRVTVSGFLDGANNLFVGTVTALTAAKMTIGGADGDVIVDEAAGESVTISKWTSRKVAVNLLPIGFLELQEAGTPKVLSTELINFTGAGVSVTDEGGGEATVNIPGAALPVVNARTGTNETLALSDQGDIVTMDNAAANTLNIPTNASVAFPVVSFIGGIQLGAGATTIQAPAGVTLNGIDGGGCTVSAQHGAFSLAKIGTDAWNITGNIGVVA